MKIKQIYEQIRTSLDLKISLGFKELEGEKENPYPRANFLPKTTTHRGPALCHPNATITSLHSLDMPLCRRAT